MTTVVELSPMVRRARRLLAQRDMTPGPTYSPDALMVLRWLAWRPGSTAELITRVQDRPLSDTARLLLRLRELGLVKGTWTTRWSLRPDGRPVARREPRWWLTEEGRAFVKLIEHEVIV